MAVILDELENQALQLSPKERGELIHRLIVSLEAEPEDSPEAIAKAWDEEIARRVAEWMLAKRSGFRQKRFLRASMPLSKTHVD